MEPYVTQRFERERSSTVTTPVKIGLFGGEGGDTKDIHPNELPSHLENIEIWSSSDGDGTRAVINGIRFTYVDNRRRRILNWGKHTGSRHQIPIDVWAREYVRKIEGNVGLAPDGDRGITSLKIITSKGEEYGPFGDRTNGYPFSVPLANSGIFAFFASADSYLNALGFYVQPINGMPSQLGSIPVVKIGLIGGDRGDTKDIRPNQLPKKLEMIEIWSSDDGECTGAVINGIRFTYVDRSGSRHIVPSKRDQAWGTAAGNYHKITINTATREYVKNIKGNVGPAHDGDDSITSLEIITSRGEVGGPFGDPKNGDDPFNVPLVNSGVFAFFARADTYLNALGFYVQPYP